VRVSGRIGENLVNGSLCQSPGTLIRLLHDLHPGSRVDVSSSSPVHRKSLSQSVERPRRLTSAIRRAIWPPLPGRVGRPVAGILLPVTGCVSVAWPASFWPLGSVVASSVSGSCSYPSCRPCRPWCASVPVVSHPLAVRGPAASPPLAHALGFPGPGMTLSMGSPSVKRQRPRLSPLAVQEGGWL
jgi:hypothetical protein